MAISKRTHGRYATEKERAKGAAKRALAKEFVDRIRAQTVCENCGAQPIDWHNLEHDQFPDRRIGRLVGIGATPKRIQKEIATCTALCRSCHMKLDGRTVRLHENKPQQKGMVYVGPRPCVKCGRLYKPLRKGLCNICYKESRK